MIVTCLAKMKLPILLLFFIFTTCINAVCQQSITPTSFIFQNDQLIIKYNLILPHTNLQDIQIWAEDRKGRKIIPIEINGDLKNVRPGKNKQVLCMFSPEKKYKKKYKIHIYSFPALDTTILYKNNLTHNYIIDHENNSYRTIRIGKQIWLAENLRVKSFADGTPLTLANYKDEWLPNDKPLYSAVNYDTLRKKYVGYLYNWKVIADNRAVCPTGWRIPKDSEWKLLDKELKNENIVGKLIENNPTHWKGIKLDSVVLNSSGFTAQPTGVINERGEFINLYSSSYWWSSSIYYGNFSCFFTIDAKKNIGEHLNGNQNQGMAIRCIKH